MRGIMQQGGVGKLRLFRAVIGKGRAGNIVEGIAGASRQAGLVINVIGDKKGVGLQDLFFGVDQ